MKHIWLLTICAIFWTFIVPVVTDIMPIECRNDSSDWQMRCRANLGEFYTSEVDCMYSCKMIDDEIGRAGCNYGLTCKDMLIIDCRFIDPEMTATKCSDTIAQYFANNPYIRRIINEIPLRNREIFKNESFIRNKRKYRTCHGATEVGSNCK